MTLLTRTGLLEGRRKQVARRTKTVTTLAETEAPICQAAPYSLRPLAALLNPYARGCSVLCNHPADTHSKDALRRIKETWPTEMRGGLLAGEGVDDALPEELFRRYTDTDSRPHTPPPLPVLVAPMGGHVGLRRCRTPDPRDRDQHGQQIDGSPHRTLLVLDLRRSRSHDTLSMAAFSESGIWPGSTMGAAAPSMLTSPHAAGEPRAGQQGAPPRRSTPPTVPAAQQRALGRPRPPRTPRAPCPSLAASRPASQATCRTPSRLPRPASQPSALGGVVQPLSQPPSPLPRSKSQGAGEASFAPLPLSDDPLSPAEALPEPMVVVTCAEDSSRTDEDSGVMRRRGKKRRGKKSGRDALREPEKEIHGFPEPGETQVSAIGEESHNPSARPSLTGASGPGSVLGVGPGGVGAGMDISEEAALAKAIKCSFLDADSLHHLQRDLDLEAVECEFEVKRRVALEEAYRLMPSAKQVQAVPRRRGSVAPASEPAPAPATETQPEASVCVGVDPSGWMAVPRVFSLRSARFELPLNSKQLSSLSPLEYVTQHVEVCPSSGQLYRRVFNLHREGGGSVLSQEQEGQRQVVDMDQAKYIVGENVVTALGRVLGRSLTEAEAGDLRERLGWTDRDRLEFRTWCGVCALAERLFAPRDDRDHPAEPRPELEQADLAGLQRRLARLEVDGLAPDPRLVRILTEISLLQ